MPTAKGTIQHNSWDEKPYHEANAQKATTAIVDVVFEGDLSGTALSRALMVYPNETTCHYSGYVIVTGTLGGKSGGFTLYELGLWSDGTACSTWEIVAGSGHGALVGIAGKGSYSAQHDKTVHYSLDYSL